MPQTWRGVRPILLRYRIILGNNPGRESARQRGSAFAVAIIVLFVLTALVLALILTASIESEVSVNYRWSEMAFSNADAGLELAKNVLAGYRGRDGDFGAALPPARGAAQMSQIPADAGACSDPAQAGCRDYQLQMQMANGSLLVIGRVLRGLDGRLLQFDFRQPAAGDLRGDLDGDGSQDIQGTVTLWVRRPIVGGLDYSANDRVVITSEGTAPNFGGAAGGRPGSLARLEIAVSLPTGNNAGDRYADPTKGSDLNSDAADAGQVAGKVQK